jgi:hypothetical protein
MERYLRAFTNYEQDNCMELFPLAEFVYNNSVHVSTRCTPFFTNYGYHLEVQFKRLKDMTAARVPTERTADAMVDGLRETYERLRWNLLDAQHRQTKYARGKEMVFEIGNKVWLSMKNVWSTRPAKKLDYMRIGLFEVSKIISNKAYKLDLRKTMRVHDVFDVLLFDWYKPPITGQHPPEPQLTIVENNEEWEVEQILGSKRRYRKLHYHLQ